MIALAPQQGPMIIHDSVIADIEGSGSLNPYGTMFPRGF